MRPAKIVTLRLAAATCLLAVIGVTLFREAEGGPRVIVAFADGHTVVSVVGRTAPDDPVSFSGGDREISVTVNRCSGAAPCQNCTGSITVSSGSMSRAEMTTALIEKLYEACPDIVIKTNGTRATSFVVSGTPTDGPNNAGTFTNPIRSPDDSNNKPGASYYTEESQQ